MGLRRLLLEPGQREREVSCADADEQKVTAVATAAKEAAAEEAATGEAAAMLASMASEEQGDETGLHCEEALPAEDQAGKSLAGSPCQPSPQVRSAEQHLGWKVMLTVQAHVAT